MKLHLVTFAIVLGAALLPSTVAAQTAEPVGPDTVVYTAKRGAVTFTHKKHAELAECAACHHESKPEKPFTAPREKCSACHTDTPAEPVKTNRRNAYHDTVKKEGVCYSCHTKEAAAGKTVPAKCADCHAGDK